MGDQHGRLSTGGITIQCDAFPGPRSGLLSPEVVRLTNHHPFAHANTKHMKSSRMPLDIAPEYALSFTANAVHLLRRSSDVEGGPAWDILGSVDFSSARFRADLAALRAEVTGGKDEGAVPVMLLIPQDQILYTSLAVPVGPDRNAAVGRALDGLTPYSIDELSFDWADEGSGVRVAAVARQTLAEAQEFAIRHGFDGAGYSAQPDSDEYPNAPIFKADVLVDDAPDSASALSLDLDADCSEGRAAKDDGDAAGLKSDDEAAEGAGLRDDDPSQKAEQPKESTPKAIPPVAQEAAQEQTSENPAITIVPGPEPKQGGAVPSDETNADESVKGEPDDEETFLVDAPPPQTPSENSTVKKLTATRAVGGTGAASSQPTSPPVVVRHGPPQGTPRSGAVPGDDLRSAAIVQRSHAPRGGLYELLAMLAALIVGLLLVWAFLVPQDNPVTDPQQIIAQTPVEVQPSEFAPSHSGDPLSQMEVAAEPGSDPPDPVSLPVQAVDEALVPDDPLTVQDAAEEVKPTSVQLDDVAAGLPVEEPAISALTAVEQALVVAAATAPLDLITSPLLAPETEAPSLAAQANEAGTATGEMTEEQVVEAATGPAQASMTSARPVPATRPEQQPTPAPQSDPLVGLSSSARPATAPRRQATPPVMDSPPSVPGNPLPFAAAQRDVERPAPMRPPSRAAVTRTAAPPPAVAQPAPATSPAQASSSAPVRLQGSARPPARPEGAIPDTLADEPLTLQELQHLEQVLGNLQMTLHLRTHAGIELHGEVVRLAEARPARRPENGGRPQQSAVDDALRSAVVDGAPPPASTSPPANRSEPTDVSARPARDSGGFLNSSRRPLARPMNRAGVNLTDSAVASAISQAIAASSPMETPPSAGGVALSALASSSLPPRKAGGAPASASAFPAAAPAAEPPALTTGPSEAERAERRRLDEQLQSQAEARIRARAQADAAAEARARAEAEARARAQVAAEERAATARRQTYRPPELDDEPEVASANVTLGTTPSSVASSATQARALDTRRTTIIGIIGAGKASRALIRLRNGRIVTVRLGDKIDGGTINSIGDGRVTYVKNNRQHELRMLDGR